MLQNNAFSSRLKLIWPRSSLKTTKMSKKLIFLAKSSGAQWVRHALCIIFVLLKISSFKYFHVPFTALYCYTTNIYCTYLFFILLVLTLLYLTCLVKEDTEIYGNIIISKLYRTCEVHFKSQLVTHLYKTNPWFICFQTHNASYSV